jgi:hypothetical protein
MSEQQPQNGRVGGQRSGARGAGGVIAGLALLVAFIALGIAIYGLARQSANAFLELPLPYVIAAGGGLTIATIVAMIRSMSVSDILEAVWEAIALLFSLLGAVLKGIWSAILGLLGWD